MFDSEAEAIATGLPVRPEPMAVIDNDSGIFDEAAPQRVEADGTLDALGARPWHAAGHRGQGIKVAVFDSQWRDWELLADELRPTATHDCFAHRSCALPIDSIAPLAGTSSGRHGVACAEVVRDVAPDAELHLVRVNSLASLENAVEWAIREEIDVISMSLSYFNNSAYDGTGDVSALMNKLVANDVLMVTSAGNYAEEHWGGWLTDEDRDGLHEFDTTRGELLYAYWSAGTRRVELTWDDWSSCGDTDLDVYVYDSQGDLVGRSTDRQRLPSQRDEDETCQPVERVSVQAWQRGWYSIVVHRHRGDRHTRLELFARNGELERPILAGSITDPGTHPGVLTVGAARVDNYLQQPVESFSSQGPLANGLTKPELTGPNGLDTLAFGPRSFFGTSAATPAVAGAVALVMSRAPELSPADAADYLRATASTASPTWEQDGALGSGHARLPPLGTGSDGGGCAGGRIFAMGLWMLPVLIVAPRRRRLAAERKAKR